MDQPYQISANHLLGVLDTLCFGKITPAQLSAYQCVRDETVCVQPLPFFPPDCGLQRATALRVFGQILLDLGQAGRRELVDIIWGVGPSRHEGGKKGGSQRRVSTHV